MTILSTNVQLPSGSNVTRGKGFAITQVEYLMFTITAFGRLRQKDPKFVGSLDHVVRPWLKMLVTVEILQQLRALAALSEDPGSMPSTHMMVHNYL